MPCARISCKIAILLILLLFLCPFLGLFRNYQSTRQYITDFTVRILVRSQTGSATEAA